TQWGGPHRNFMSDAAGLASTWPAAGPKRLWSRPLGEGHRRSQEEVIVALDAATGKTVWELKYPSTTDGVDFSQGAGPHSTPLIAGNRIFATSSKRELFALDKATGTVAWSHDFIKEYSAPSPDRGYACSPLAFNGNVIVTVGGANQAVASFRQN